MVDQSRDGEVIVEAGCLSSGTACRATLTSRVMELWHLSPGKIFGKGADSGRSERIRRRMVDSGCLSSSALVTLVTLTVLLHGQSLQQGSLSLSLSPP